MSRSPGVFPCCVYLLRVSTPHDGVFSDDSGRSRPFPVSHSDEITEALLNGLRAPAMQPQLSLRAPGSGTFILLQPQGRTRFNGSLCRPAIECSAFQHLAQPQ